jgi:putative CocE/NonD family hydrolase
MQAAVISTGPHDFSRFIWGSGAFIADGIAWADLLTRMKRGGLVPLPLYMRGQKARLRPIIDSVPLLDAVDKYFQGNTPHWLRQTITLPDRADPYWKPLQHGSALERANIPILITTGWYDLILESTIEQYSRLIERGCSVGVTIGPWTHLGAGGRNNMPEILGWLDQHVAQRADAARSSPVRIFITGAQEWRDLPKWPPATSAHELYLCPGKKLSRDGPPADAPDSVFKFDPAEPTPAIGVPLLFDGGNMTGGLEDTALAARSDVLVFNTEPLDRDLEICGKPSVELCHSSDHPYVDLLVRLSEVDNGGKSHSVAEKYMRLDPNRGQDP